MTRRHYAAVAVALVVAFVAGWYLKPQPDVTLDEAAGETVRVEYASAFDAREQWVLATEAESNSSAVTIAYRHKRTEPSGATEETSLDVTGTASQVKEATKGAGSSQTTATEAERGYVDRWHTKTVEVRSQPDWLLSAQVGAGSVGVMYGGQVSRRVLGPLHLQAGAMAGGGEWIATGGVGLAW